MYSIVHVIYGYPLTGKCWTIINEFEQDHTTDYWFEDDEGPCGFTTRYSGVGEGFPGWVGVELWSAPCAEPLALHAKPMVPTLEQQLEASDRVEALHPRLKEALRKELKMGVYCVFSTS